MDADETFMAQSFPHLHEYAMNLCARSVPHLLYSLPPPWKSIRTRLGHLCHLIERVDMTGLRQLTAYGTSDCYLLVSDEVKQSALGRR